VFFLAQNNQVSYFSLSEYYIIVPSLPLLHSSKDVIVTLSFIHTINNCRDLPDFKMLDITTQGSGLIELGYLGMLQ
jgi:hypothetical protein